MDKNPSANAGDAGLIPGLGKFQMLWTTKACMLQLLKPVYLEPVSHNKRGHHDKAHAPQLESGPQSPPLEKAHTQRRPRAGNV